MCLLSGLIAAIFITSLFLACVCSGVGARRREGRMGIQSTETNDKNQLQAGMCCTSNTVHLHHSDMNYTEGFYVSHNPCRPIFPRWWTGTSNSLRTSEVLSLGTTQRSPSTLFWTTSLPPNRYGHTAAIGYRCMCPNIFYVCLIFLKCMCT